MDDEAFQRALQCEVLPRRTGVVAVRDECTACLLVGLARDEKQKNSGVAAPDLITLDQQAEEERPVLRVAMCVKDAPGMRIAG